MIFISCAISNDLNLSTIMVHTKLKTIIILLGVISQTSKSTLLNLKPNRVNYTIIFSNTSTIRAIIKPTLMFVLTLSLVVERLFVLHLLPVWSTEFPSSFSLEDRIFGLEHRISISFRSGAQNFLLYFSQFFSETSAHIMIHILIYKCTT